MVLPADALAGFKRDRTPLGKTITDQTASPHASTGGGAAFLRMLVGLVIVIGVILVVYWLLKRLGGKSKGVLRNDGQIEVLATTALAANRAVHLLRVGGELVLVGSTDGGITPIRVYDTADLQELGLDPAEAAFTPVTPTRGKRGTLLEELRKRTTR